MSQEEKKKPFIDPNGLYRAKNIIGFLSILIGGAIAGVFIGCLFMGVVGSLVADDGGEVLDKILEFVGSWKIDVGLAILLGSTIISGGVLLSGIKKV